MTKSQIICAIAGFCSIMQFGVAINKKQKTDVIITLIVTIMFLWGAFS